MRGRKPKLTARQISEGDPRKRGIHKLEQRLASEPQATSGLPACPKHLNERARSAWMFWADELAAMKLSKRPDGPMLEGACVMYSRAVEADLIVQRDGIVVEEKFINDDGEAIVLKVSKHPAVEISNRCWMNVKAFCSEFGLSPVSRMRLSVASKDVAGEADDLMALLSRPRVSTADRAIIPDRTTIQ